MKTFYCLLFIFMFTACALAQTKRKPEPIFNPTGSFSQLREALPLFPCDMGICSQGIDIEIRTTTFEVMRKGMLIWFPIPSGGSLIDAWNVSRIVGGDQANPEYKFNKIELNSLQIVFSTETVNGISYSFSGQFLKSGRYHKLPPKGTVLTGKITRIRNGKDDGTANIEFRWQPRD